MKYSYNIKIEGIDQDHYYAVIDFDRELVKGSFYRSSFDLPIHVKSLLDDLFMTEGVTGDLLLVDGNQLTIRINPFFPELTVARLVTRIYRRFAIGEALEQVSKKELQQHAEYLNMAKERKAVEIMVEAAKILPGQDPIRLASALKDLYKMGFNPQGALETLRHLAKHFKGDNADPIRLVAGYKDIVAIVNA